LIPHAPVLLDAARSRVRPFGLVSVRELRDPALDTLEGVDNLRTRPAAQLALSRLPDQFQKF